MTAEGSKLFIEACESAGIKSYAFVTDVSTTLYHDGERSILKPSYANNFLVCLRDSRYSGTVKKFDAGIQVLIADFSDVHEVICGGDTEQIKAFCEALGDVNLEDEDLKVLLQIDKGNYNINPITGDYVNGFKYLSPWQYDQLTPEQQAEYDEKKAAYEKAKAEYIAPNQAASISF